MMRYIALLMTLAVFLAGCGQSQAVREEKAVSAILKLGGQVVRDEKLPGWPVVFINMSSLTVTDADLKELKELKGLREFNLVATKIKDHGRRPEGTEET